MQAGDRALRGPYPGPGVEYANRRSQRRERARRRRGLWSESGDRPFRCHSAGIGGDHVQINGVRRACVAHVKCRLAHCIPVAGLGRGPGSGAPEVADAKSEKVGRGQHLRDSDVDPGVIALGPYRGGPGFDPGDHLGACGVRVVFDVEVDLGAGWIILRQRRRSNGCTPGRRTLGRCPRRRVVTLPENDTHARADGGGVLAGPGRADLVIWARVHVDEINREPLFDHARQLRRGLCVSVVKSMQSRGDRD